MAFGETALAAGFLMIENLHGRLSPLEYEEKAYAAFVEWSSNLASLSTIAYTFGALG